MTLKQRILVEIGTVIGFLVAPIGFIWELLVNIPTSIMRHMNTPFDIRDELTRKFKMEQIRQSEDQYLAELELSMQTLNQSRGRIIGKIEELEEALKLAEAGIELAKQEIERHKANL